MEMLAKILNNEKANENSTARVIYKMINYGTWRDLTTKRREHVNAYIPCNEQVLEGSEQMCVAGGSAEFSKYFMQIGEEIRKTGNTRRPAFVQPQINDELGILEGIK